MATSVDRERKNFSVAAANRTLPLVSRIVRDIVDVDARLRDVDRAANALLRSGDKEGAVALQDELQELVREHRELVNELAQVGLNLKDAREGLVDFPSHREGRAVFLSWKLGEDRVTSWHEAEKGLAGRQPIGEGDESFGAESLGAERN